MRIYYLPCTNSFRRMGTSFPIEDHGNCVSLHVYKKCGSLNSEQSVSRAEDCVSTCSPLVWKFAAREVPSVFTAQNFHYIILLSFGPSTFFGLTGQGTPTRKEKKVSI